MKIKCPAKINLNLKIIKKLENGYHEIESIMQTVDLYDFLTIEKLGNGIILEGNNKNVPYNEQNTVYKIVQEFLKETKLKAGFKIYIEKNIPMQAGLAGGSTDAVGALIGINKMFDDILPKEKLHEICAKIGSDLNFCLEGGKCLTRGRGEKLTKLPYEEFELTLVKPRNIAISTPYAYKKFDTIKEKSTFLNDLEFALIKEFKEFQYLHNLGFQMTGSGSCFFKIGFDDTKFNSNYLVFKNVKTTKCGVQIFS